MKPSYSLARGPEYDSTTIKTGAKPHKTPFEHSQEARLPRHQYETKKDAAARRRARSNEKVQQEINVIDTALQTQWPTQDPSLIDLDYTNSSGVTGMARIHFNIWFNNLQFLQYLTHVCDILRAAKTAEVEVPFKKLARATYKDRQGIRKVGILDLLQRVTPPMPADESMLIEDVNIPAQQDSSDDEQLRTLSKSLRADAASCQELTYLDHLDESISCLRSLHDQPSTNISNPVDHELIGKLHAKCHASCASLLRDIRGILNVSSQSAAQAVLSSW